VRPYRFQLFLLGCLVVLVLGPVTAFPQFPPGGGDQGGFRMRGPRDPNFLFNIYSGGKDVFNIDNIPEIMTQRDPQMKDRIRSFLERKGVNNGLMTRDLFAEYMEERRAERSGARRDGIPGASPTAPPPSDSDLEKEARDRFARYDRNGDGVLSADELPPSLASERDKWDKNKNGLIEFEEFKEYWKDRRAQQSAGGSQGSGVYPTVAPPPAEEDKKPTVYRIGNYPRELPVWFVQLDTDKDGQVGLYEWKAAGRPVDEFVAMDQNGDGFLTVEEVLRHQRATVKANTPAQTGIMSAYAPPDPNSGNRGGRIQGNGPGRGGPRGGNPSVGPGRGNWPGSPGGGGRGNGPPGGGSGRGNWPPGGN
jgi:Ca2+-binding EF-hand superfamily protein